MRGDAAAGWSHPQSREQCRCPECWFPTFSMRRGENGVIDPSVKLLSVTAEVDHHNDQESETLRQRGATDTSVSCR
eukprot:m.109215 g.109215  ORF g.109215 m.109215 type:complete len:76 (+) comp15964_c0_seq3:241-468(+)